ncbi:hypothetical protein, partial [Niastella yeongjuensis]|uniref:hypothetical protein n=1 Tax=Niastella yeongjuensis TaxID=354355 RepID=UPI0013FD462A
ANKFQLAGSSNLNAIYPAQISKSKLVELIQVAYGRFVGPYDLEAGIVIDQLKDLSQKIAAGKIR